MHGGFSRMLETLKDSVKRLGKKSVTQIREILRGWTSVECKRIKKSFACNLFRLKVDILYVHHSREFSMVIDYPKSYKPELNRNPGCAF